MLRISVLLVAIGNTIVNVAVIEAPVRGWTDVARRSGHVALCAGHGAAFRRSQTALTGIGSGADADADGGGAQPGPFGSKGL